MRYFIFMENWQSINLGVRICLWHASCTGWIHFSLQSSLSSLSLLPEPTIFFPKQFEKSCKTSSGKIPIRPKSKLPPRHLSLPAPKNQNHLHFELPPHVSLSLSLQLILLLLTFITTIDAQPHATNASPTQPFPPSLSPPQPNRVISCKSK